MRQLVFYFQTVHLFFFSFSEEKKKQKEELFSKVLGVSTVATVDSGRRPKNPQTFEKV